VGKRKMDEWRRKEGKERKGRKEGKERKERKEGRKLTKSAKVGIKWNEWKGRKQ
jgi:hypothetical protein